MRTGLCCLTAAALGLLLIHVPAAAQTAASPDVRAWMSKQDGNGDGKLDRGEFDQAVVEAFFLRDKDKDGFLAIIELTEASPEALKAVKRKDDARISLQEYALQGFRGRRYRLRRPADRRGDRGVPEADPVAARSAKLRPSPPSPAALR